MPRDVWVINPRYSDLVQRLGLTNSETVEKLSCIVVNGHVRRNVSRATVDGHRIYIKREHEIRLRVRLRAWRDGHGLASLAGREVNILDRLQELAPTWLAWGEKNGKSWLILDSVGDYKDFTTYFTEEQNPFNRRLTLGVIAKAIAEIHDRGVYQEDLFAKHILLLAGRGVKFLDWQRAKIQPSISVSQRLRSIQRIYSSMPSDLLSKQEWKIFVQNYFQVAQINVDIDKSLQGIQRNDTLSTKARLSLVPTFHQELMRYKGEKICAIPEFYPQLVKILEQLYSSGSRFLEVDGELFFLDSQSQRLSISRCVSRIRGKVWRSQPLQQARLVMHLQRYGLICNEIIAYGQQPTIFGGKSFILSRVIQTDTPINLSIPNQTKVAEAALARLHEVGVILKRDRLPFFYFNGELAYDIRGLRLYRNLNQFDIHRDQKWLKQKIEIAQRDSSQKYLSAIKGV